MRVVLLAVDLGNHRLQHGIVHLPLRLGPLDAKPVGEQVPHVLHDLITAKPCAVLERLVNLLPVFSQHCIVLTLLDPFLPIRGNLIMYQAAQMQYWHFFSQTARAA